jgi:hypothetical protein
MNTTPQSLQSERSTPTSRSRGRILVAAILTPVVLGVGAAGAGAVATDPASCVVDGVTSADAAERRIQRCLDAVEAAYTDCMLDAPGTPDSLERWAPLCRATVAD